jgi:hypothetical protein
MEEKSLAEINLELVNSNINTNIFTENTEALTKAISMSPRNEITDLSHALMCLADNDFEEYVSAIRILRATSKAFSSLGKIRSSPPAEKVEIPFVSNNNSEPKTKFRSGKKTNKTIMREALEELLADGTPVYHFDCYKHVYKALYGKEPEEGSKHRLDYINVETTKMNLVNKKGGFWSLK